MNSITKYHCDVDIIKAYNMYHDWKLTRSCLERNKKFLKLDIGDYYSGCFENPVYI